MIELIERHRAEMEAICLRFHVRELALFGSAAGAAFDPDRSDLDFLVTFQPSEPRRHYEDYFGLLEGLGKLFRKSIDLVEADAMRNPYFISSVRASQRRVYAA